MACRAWIGGHTVLACDRVFGIFQGDVELITRGRRHKPVEFGQTLLLGQTKDKFITQHDVMEERMPDPALSGGLLEKRKAAFGHMPKELVGDMGFCGEPEAMDELRRKVKMLATPQRLRAGVEEGFVLLQHFRQGIGGSISVPKRVLGILRCRHRSLRGLVSNVALGVFPNNLVLFARPRNCEVSRANIETQNRHSMAGAFIRPRPELLTSICLRFQMPLPPAQALMNQVDGATREPLAALFQQEFVHSFGLE